MTTQGKISQKKKKKQESGHMALFWLFDISRSYAFGKVHWDLFVSSTCFDGFTLPGVTGVSLMFNDIAFGMAWWPFPVQILLLSM